MTPYDFAMTEGKQESGMCHHQLHQGCGMPIQDSLAKDCAPRRIGDGSPYAPYMQIEGAGTGESIHGIDLPGFDSDAHRAFMRSLG